MDTKNRWTAEAWWMWSFPRRRLFPSPVLPYRRNPAKRNINAGDTTRTGGLQCQVSSTWPSAKRRTTSNTSPWVGTLVTNWMNQVSGWYSVLVLSDTIFLFRFQGGWCLDSDLGGWKPWWGRKVYAQGMGSEAISRVLRWVQTSTDVQVPRFFFQHFLYRWYGSDIPNNHLGCIKTL